MIKNPEELSYSAHILPSPASALPALACYYNNEVLQIPRTQLLHKCLFPGKCSTDIGIPSHASVHLGWHQRSAPHGQLRLYLRELHHLRRPHLCLHLLSPFRLSAGISDRLSHHRQDHRRESPLLRALQGINRLHSGLHTHVARCIVPQVPRAQQVHKNRIRRIIR